VFYLLYADIGGLQGGDMLFALISFILFLSIIMILILLIFRFGRKKKQLERIESKLDQLLNEQNNNI
jgi:flagellar biogenesis protein FliO